MKPRTRARMLSLEVLYEFDIADHDAIAVLSRRVHEEAIETMIDQQENEDREEREIEDEKLNPETVRFASDLVHGVIENIAALDEQISRLAPDWPIDQIAVIDRNVLRIAIYELLYTYGSHEIVAVNEAVDVAKSYGSDSSARFVHGVLGTLMGDLGIPKTEPLPKVEMKEVKPHKQKNKAPTKAILEAMISA